MYLIAGLGNPGRRYAKTRHNAGFLLLDRLAARATISFRMEGDALVAKGRLAGQPVLLAKPQTYMNLSGASIRRLVAEHEVDLGQLLVAYDEAALPLGVLRFRPRGSAGGQQGMRSVIEKLGTPEISRLRIGVGDPDSKPPDDLSDYVLARFTARERAELEQILERACDGVETFVTEGIERAMARYNSRKSPEEGGGS